MVFGAASSKSVHLKSSKNVLMHLVQGYLFYVREYLLGFVCHLLWFVCGLLWFVVVCCGLLWFVVVCCGLLWFVDCYFLVVIVCCPVW
jgi:hypothetical protein